MGKAEFLAHKDLSSIEKAAVVKLSVCKPEVSLVLPLMVYV